LDANFKIYHHEKKSVFVEKLIKEMELRNYSSKFTVIPKRWVVERTFAWFESYRRLSKDFEFRTDTSEDMIQFAMIKLMLDRIKK
jgi:transposase